MKKRNVAKYVNVDEYVYTYMRKKIETNQSFQGYIMKLGIHCAVC